VRCLGQSALCKHTPVWRHRLLLFGGLRAPLKPTSRALPPCPLPLAMRGTAMGPLPLGPAIAPLEGWCRRSREARRETWGALGVKEGGGLSWWAKAPCGRCCGGGCCWWWWGASGRSEFGWLVGAKVVMALARAGTTVQGRCRVADSVAVGEGQESGARDCLISLALPQRRRRHTARLHWDWLSKLTRATSLTAGSSSIRTYRLAASTANACSWSCERRGRVQGVVDGMH
jgi:hypothetical protein